MEKKRRGTPSEEEMKALAKRMDERLASFLSSGRYKDVLLCMGNLSRYSLHNQLCILFQFPSASRVAGIRGWNRLGRRVRRGEKGIRIYQPIFKKKEEGEEGKALAFRVGCVFDLSQTEGEEIKAFRLDEDSEVEEKRKIVEGLKRTLDELGYSFAYVGGEELGENCYGLCSHKEKAVKVKEGMGDLQTISTLIHECAHALAHGAERKDFEGLRTMEKREIKEVEAESIACIVCAHLGLETEEFNFSYIAGWASGDIAKFRKNLDLVSSCARRLIAGIEEEREKKDE